MQADSLHRTCKFHLRTFFHPLIFFSNPPLKTVNHCFQFPKIIWPVNANTPAYADESKPESLDLYICMWQLQWHAFHCKALNLPSFQLFLHYVHHVNLLSCWETPAQCVGLQVFTETLTMDNVWNVRNVSLIFVICLETLTHNWFLTSCLQPAAMPSRSLLSGCCSFHPAVGFLVLSPCGCKEKGQNVNQIIHNSFLTLKLVHYPE